MRESLVSDGCLIEQGAVIENSVIGLRCRIGRNVVIRNSVVLGSDFYETPNELATDAARGEPPLGIGEGTIIELEKLAGEPVNLTIGGKIVAQGEVVVIGMTFGIKITQVFHSEMRGAMQGG